jgi:hypothetical protein
MKNSNNIFLGVILIVLGGLTLGVINDWFSFDVSMREIAKFWPILIILAGLAVIIDSKRTVLNGTTVLLVALAIPFGIYNCTNSTIDRVGDEISRKGFDFDVDIDDNDSEFSYEEGNSDSSKADHQSFKVENKTAIKSVKLNISGGAAQFILSEPTSSELFLADTKMANGGTFSLKEETSGAEHRIDFKMKSQKRVRINKDGINRKVTLKINPEPIWDISMEVGAGDVKYDLTQYKIEKIKLETGASNVELKMGDLLNESKVDIDSGVANIKIQVPENVGCEIKMDGALNAKNFTGFTKISGGLYRTEGFDSATKKIYINTDSGMSNISVNRY